MSTTPDAMRCCERGELTVIGRIRSASNATFLCEAILGERTQHCVYKPVRGEAPLWDFPDGTLAGRELARTSFRRHWAGTSCPTPSFATVLPAPGCCSDGSISPSDDDRTMTPARTGPDLIDLLPAGKIPAGFLPVLQAYDYAGDEVTLVHADDDRLRRVAVFDVLINNADRKGGHVLSGVDGQRLRRRPRRHPARRGQAAHRAVGVGGQARRRRHPRGRRRARRRARRRTSAPNCAATSRRGRSPRCAPESLRC